MPSVRGGIYFSKSRLIIVAAVWLALTILIAVLVGVLKRCPDADDNVPLTTASPGAQSTLSPTPDPNKPWESLRLPTNILPSHYIITLNPNFYTDDAADFQGSVEIEMAVSSPAKHVLIHIKNMNISYHELTDNRTGAVVQTELPFTYPKNQFWVLPIAGTLGTGAYRLKMNFTGSLVGISGFYKSSYYDPNTKQNRHIVSSKFEPVDARKAFPCFDEPQIKAQYTVKLIYKPAGGYFALSNMPVAKNETIATGVKMSTFQRSVTMSTYLVCFVICDFTFIQGRSRGDKLFRVFAPKHKSDQLQYALDVGINVQNYFEGYFNMSYTLPKQDMIAIPNFAAGAMEHWGLITYRESALLYNKKYHSLIDKFYVNRVIAHELAHMWFGNVVTMEWWDDLWLNEGFASFASYKGMKNMEPSWDTDALARLYSTRVAFEVDDVISSHPIIVAVNTPAELTEAFDTITYRKGQAVILMLEGLMSEPKFKLGIQDYMKQFEFANAKTSQLWGILKTKTDLPLTQIMNTWTLQMGFPVITVSTSNPPTAKQEWYLLDPSSRSQAPSSPYEYLWRVRLNYNSSAASPSGLVWMNQVETVTLPPNIDLSNSDSWILLNTNADGFYRVNYPPDLWKRFPQLLKQNKVTMTQNQKAALVDDAMYLARAGYLGYDAAMTVLSMARITREFPIWIRSNSALAFLMRMTSSRPLYGQMRKFVQNLTSDIYDTLLRNETTDLHESLLRRAVFSLSCYAGSVKCRNDMKSLFLNWKSNSSIPLDLREIALRIGLEEDDTEATWTYMWNVYQASDNDPLKSEIINALASTSHPWLINRLLSYAMDPKLIKEQEFFSVMYDVASKPTGQLVYWTWIRENWAALLKRFGLESRGLGRMIIYISPRLKTQVQLNEMNEFFKRYPNAGAGSRSRMQGKSVVEANIRWLANNEANLATWLQANVAP